MRRSLVYWLAGAMVAWAWVAGSSAEDAPAPRVLGDHPEATDRLSRNSGLDRLLGGGQREAHTERLAKTRIAGKIHEWNQYATWGRELFHEGQVQSPPAGVGPSPSTPLSDIYRCIDCHNVNREDPELTIQDPDSRAAWIANDPDRRMILASGTTMWGAVQRESFYNGMYETYHFLRVPGDRAMNPTSLEDATQVCCRFCSVGRFAETWEILALLTYFWELEIRLADLQLPERIEQEVLATLSDPEAEASGEASATRDLLRRLYLRRAGATYTPPPTIEDDGLATYPDKSQFRGSPEEGAILYRMACDHCHGEDKPSELADGDLVRELGLFHRILAKGTSHDDEPYMPFFPAERLSRQQILDIQSHLQGL